MPNEHGSAAQSSDLAAPSIPAPPTVPELAVSRAPEGTVLSHALQRVRDELRDLGSIGAGFDNRLR